jgi:septin family protein
MDCNEPRKLVDSISELDEEGTRISLTIVDTPGFGDQIDNEARYAVPIDDGDVRSP